MTASSIEWFQLVSVRKPNRKLFSTCLRAYAKQLTLSKLMTASSIEWFQLVSVRKPNRKPFSTCPRAYAKQLKQCLRRKIKSSQHHSLKTGSRLMTVMTASFEWFQLVSVRKANRKPFSTCPSAYAKQLAQCSCGSAVSSNSHEKFHWPIQYLWPQ